MAGIHYRVLSLRIVTERLHTGKPRLENIQYRVRQTHTINLSVRRGPNHRAGTANRFFFCSKSDWKSKYRVQNNPSGTLFTGLLVGKTMEILTLEEIPSWLQYPPEYLRLLDQNIMKFAPWYLLDAKLARLRYEGLQKRYPNRRLFAFAARMDNDDIACWEDGKSGRVLIIHDFAAEGFSDRKEFALFWDWFRAAMEEMITQTLGN